MRCGGYELLFGCKVGALGEEEVLTLRTSTGSCTPYFPWLSRFSAALLSCFWLLLLRTFAARNRWWLNVSWEANNKSFLTNKKTWRFTESGGEKNTGRTVGGG